MPPTGFQADTVIEMLLNASDQMSQHLEVTSARRRHGHDAHTLLRVLCHKKDKISSTFLRIQYHLPRSSGEINGHDLFMVYNVSHIKGLRQFYLAKSRMFTENMCQEVTFAVHLQCCAFLQN